MARLEKIKAKLANEEYKRITRNVNPQVNTFLQSLYQITLYFSKIMSSYLFFSQQEMNHHGTLADFGRQGQDVPFFYSSHI